MYLGLAYDPIVWRWKAEGAAPNRRIGSTKDSFLARVYLKVFRPKFHPAFRELACNLVFEVHFDTQAIGSTSQSLN